MNFTLDYFNIIDIYKNDCVPICLKYDARQRFGGQVFSNHPSELKACT